MNEKIKLFLKNVQQDEALAEKFKSITNPDEAYALAASLQDGFTKEEFISAMEQLNSGDLSKDDLTAMASGSQPTDTIPISFTVSGTVMIASAGAV